MQAQPQLCSHEGRPAGLTPALNSNCFGGKLSCSSSLITTSADLALHAITDEFACACVLLFVRVGFRVLRSVPDFS